jgi:hypothetical protein
MAHKKFMNLVLVISTCLITLGLAMVLQCLSVQINGEQLLTIKFSSPDFSKYNPFTWIIQIIYLLLATALPILLMENEE